VPELTDAPEPRAWTVIYDADCGFCRWLLSLVLTADHQRRLVPLALGTRAADELLSDLSLGDQFASWHLVSPSGERQSAGAALPTLAALLPGGRLPAAALSHTGLINDRGYRWVAGHRSWFGRVIPGGAKDRASALIAERSTPQL
jgi:predicted DCC family thiol-disulfide oxidoreductase YuxK